MICISHGENTYDKSIFLGNPEVELSDEAKKKIMDMIDC